MSFNGEIKQLKEAHSAMVIEKAKSEERLASLHEQRDKIFAQCKEIGIAPDQLASEKERLEKEINEILEKARELMGLEKDSSDKEDFNAPF